jgi:adenine-specific DNA-methyltransferase
VKLNGTEFEKQPSAIEQKAYRDTWGVSAADRKIGITSLDRYLRWFADAAVLLYDLLASTGSIFVHLDWHVAAYVKVMLDEIFGATNFRNEVIWCYTGPGSPGMQQFNRKHDNILWFSKSDKWSFYPDAIRVPHNPKTEANFKAGLSGSGFVADTYDLAEGGKIPEDWWEMAIAGRYPVDGVKRVGYPTEKPWPLVERVIKATTKEDDLVLDCFSGSGLTATVSEALGRRWIARRCQSLRDSHGQEAATAGRERPPICGSESW